MTLEFSRQIFEEFSDIKFRENPSSGSRVVPCGRTDGQTGRRADMKKLIVAFRDIAKVPKKSEGQFYSPTSPTSGASVSGSQCTGSCVDPRTALLEKIGNMKTKNKPTKCTN